MHSKNFKLSDSKSSSLGFGGSKDVKKGSQSGAGQDLAATSRGDKWGAGPRVLGSKRSVTEAEFSSGTAVFTGRIGKASLSAQFGL